MSFIYLKVVRNRIKYQSYLLTKRFCYSETESLKVWLTPFDKGGMQTLFANTRSLKKEKKEKRSMMNALSVVVATTLPSIPVGPEFQTS